MLKGSRSSLSDGEPGGNDQKPRKKLSFREPEVMGAVDRKQLEENSRRNVLEVERREEVSWRKETSQQWREEDGRRGDQERKRSPQQEWRKGSPQKDGVRRGDQEGARKAGQERKRSPQQEWTKEPPLKDGGRRGDLEGVGRGDLEGGRRSDQDRRRSPQEEWTKDPPQKDSGRRSDQGRRRSPQEDGGRKSDPERTRSPQEDVPRWSDQDSVRGDEEDGRNDHSQEGARRKISVVERGDLMAPEEGRKKAAGETERRRMQRSLTADSYWLHRRISEEDEDELESQAMKIVRTVGQAFEVCHKLSAHSPVDVDDSDQDPIKDPLHDLEASSEKDSDAFSDIQRRGDGMSDVILGGDSDLNLESPVPSRGRHLHLEMLPPPPVSYKTSSTTPGAGETISSPLLEPLKDSGDVEVPSAGTPLSAHHEIQLLREQLEQQCQQTQAAVAQVHLIRDQLSAETAARMEAQARTHQLLVHNKELLDHITALVSHLQDQERIKPSLTIMPQTYGEQYLDPSDAEVFMTVDNRNSGAFVTAPSSPKTRHSSYLQTPQPLQTASSLYSLYPSAEQQFQAQLLQRLQGVSPAYSPLLSPPIYSTLPYNLCTFPSPYFAKRREEDPPPTRLEPPPFRKTNYREKSREAEKSREVEREKSRDREKSREAEREEKSRVVEKSRDGDFRDKREGDRNVREKSRDADYRDKSRDSDFRDKSRDTDFREKSRDTDREKSRDAERDFREKSRDAERDFREKSRDAERDFREKSREVDRDVRERSREVERNVEKAKVSRFSPLPSGLLSPRSAKSPSPGTSGQPVHSPKSSYTTAFASALSTIRTLRVTGGGADKTRKLQAAAPGPITRSTSEKVSNRSELMDLVQRTAWARQTK